MRTALLLALCLPLLIVGCGESGQPEPNPLYTVSSSSAVYVMEYIDPKTGVRYLIVSKTGSSSANPGAGVAIIKAEPITNPEK